MPNKQLKDMSEEERPKKLSPKQLTNSVFNIGDAVNYHNSLLKAVQQFFSDYIEYKGDTKGFDEYCTNKYEELNKVKESPDGKK